MSEFVKKSESELKDDGKNASDNIEIRVYSESEQEYVKKDVPSDSPVHEYWRKKLPFQPKPNETDEEREDRKWFMEFVSRPGTTMIALVDSASDLTNPKYGEKRCASGSKITEDEDSEKKK